MESELDKHLKQLRDSGYRPRIEGPKRSRIEDILKQHFAMPTQEAERFLALIYEGRRRDREPVAK